MSTKDSLPMHRKRLASRPRGPTREAIWTQGITRGDSPVHRTPGFSAPLKLGPQTRLNVIAQERQRAARAFVDVKDASKFTMRFT
eukprot:4793965-Pyramimonas_sp.AAC.1